MTNQASSIDTPEMIPGEMSLLEHLDELRQRLIKSFVAVMLCTVAATLITNPILHILIEPYGQPLKTLGPTEGIVIYFRVALTAGLAFAMPFLVYQLLMFILPGLERHEAAYIWWGVPAATILFLIGAAFAWYILIPTAVNFLSTWQSDVFVAEWQPQRYIPFVTSLLFWIGVSFEMPLIIFIMARIGIVTPQFLISQWRYAVVIIAIMAAVITPTPDPINMSLVMLPLAGLYGISILLAYLA